MHKEDQMAVNTQVAKERPAIRHARHVSGRNTARESFGDFTQVISHRIGSLLSSIEGYTDLVLSSLDQREDRENAFRILKGSLELKVYCMTLSTIRSLFRLKLIR